MTVIRIIIGLLALIVVATVAFGQEPWEAWDNDDLLSGENVITPGQFQLMQPNQENVPIEWQTISKDDAHTKAAQKPASKGPVTIPVSALPRVKADDTAVPAPKVDTTPSLARPSNTVNDEQDDSLKTLKTNYITPEVAVGGEDGNDEEENMQAAQQDGPTMRDMPRVEPSDLPLDETLTRYFDPREVVDSEELDTFKRPLRDVAGIGILTARNGGFSEGLWDGVAREHADKLMMRLQEEGLHSQAARRLLQRALLTSAEAPVGESDINWLALRAETLQSLGMAEAAAGLINHLRVSDLEQDERLARVWTANHLLQGELTESCSLVRQKLMDTQKSSFWHQAQLVCQALEGNVDKLRLTLSLLQEQDIELPTFFGGLLKAALNSDVDSPLLKPDQRLSTLESALYLAAPSLINPEVIQRLPDMALRRVVNNMSLGASVRLQAAEKLVNDYTLPADVAALTTLYSAVEFEVSAMESPLQAAETQSDGSLARALLWQSAITNSVASAKALLLKKLWERAEFDGLTELPASITPNLLGITPREDLAWFSPYVVRTALRGGNLPVARSWWEILLRHPQLSREMMNQRADLALAFGLLNRSLDPVLLQEWWQSRDLYNEDVLEQAQRALAVLEAVDVKVPLALWQDLHTHVSDVHGEQTKGPGALWLRLVGASLEEGQTGGSILLLLEPLMYEYPVSMAPQGIANIVAGLKYLGLKEDATVMAFEALLHDKMSF